MHRYQFATFFVLTLLLTVSGCTKHAEGIAGATGPTGQAGANGATVKSSPITGFIQLFDPYANPYPTSPGVTLSVLKGDSLLTTTTDSTGKFAFPPVPPGSYSIHVTKPGFDSLEIYVQHSGGDDAKFLGETNLIQTLTAKIINQTASFQLDQFGNPEVVLTISYTDPVITWPVQREFYFYFSHTPGRTSQNADYTIGSGYTTGGNQFSAQLLLTNLTQYSPKPFHSGDTVYLETIVEHNFINSPYYYDYSADRYISYPYPGDSATTWFKMP
jgi:hypothetical protein